MKTKLVIAFYSFGLLHHLFTTYYSKTQVDFTKTTKPKVLDVQQFTNRFLTSWNMGLQTLYFLIALTYEILLLNKERISSTFLETFSKVRGYMFATLVLPCTMVVAIFFWMFYYIKKEFVVPDGLEEVVPNWVNHSIHTNILLLPLIELALPKIYTPSMWQAFIGITIFSHIYNAMYVFTYFETGKWMYALYEHLSWPQRIAMMELMYIIGLIVCQLGLAIQKMKPDKCDIKEKYHNVARVTKKLL